MEDIKTLLEQLGSDIRVLTDLLVAIEFNKTYNEVLGKSYIKELEKMENTLYNFRSKIENKYLMIGGKDIVELYKLKKKNESIQDIINRLQK